MPAPGCSVRSRKETSRMASGDSIMSHPMLQTNWTESAGCLKQILDACSLQQMPSWKTHTIISLVQNDINK